MPQVNFPVDDSLHRRAKSAAAIAGKSLKQWIIDAMERELAESRETRKPRRG